MAQSIVNVGVYAPATKPAKLLLPVLSPPPPPPVAIKQKVDELEDKRLDKKVSDDEEKNGMDGLLRRGRDNLLPSESRQIYIERYNVYTLFIKQHGLQYIEDHALIWAEYMREEREFGPSSMYSYWSAIKAVLAARDNIDAGQWLKMKKWLKNYADGKFSDQAPAFTAEEVKDFLINADDDIYIRHKLALGMGLYGRLRASEYPWLFHDKNKKEKIRIYKSYVFVFECVVIRF